MPRINLFAQKNEDFSTNRPATVAALENSQLKKICLYFKRDIRIMVEEACREQGEVATSKKEAMRIVQRKFEEMEKRGSREVSGAFGLSF